MSGKLIIKAVTKFTVGILLVGLLLFVPAGTFRYPGAWLFMGSLFIPMLAAGIVLMVKNPALLARRLQTKERQIEQRWITALGGGMFLLGFAAAGLSFRYGVLMLPGWVSISAAAVLLLAYGLYAEVLRENTWLSRTVEVQAGQKVIDTGLYGFVRHPMYSITILLFLSMPLVLGSLISFFIFLAYPAIIVRRIYSEETLLGRELAGYAAYCEKVRFRLIPYIW